MRALVLAALSLPLSLAASLASADAFDRLLTALKIDEVVDILIEEGTASGLSLEDSMFPGRGGPAWEAEIARIYDAEAHAALIRSEMDTRLEGTDLAPLVDFLESETGAQIMALEVSARRAFIDPEMETIASELFAGAEEETPELHAQVMEFTEVNDLVGQNVKGAFRSNAAFALGAHEAGAFPGATVDQVIARLWAGDEAVEADVSDWLYAYLMTAYKPLPPEDLEAYIALSRSDEGQALNQAIMGSFDRLFSKISYDLGSAAGRFMAQQDL
ncbi:MAG: hypothetical protein AAFR53_02780 [Pseudomonadota bacterium]